MWKERFGCTLNGEMDISKVFTSIFILSLHAFEWAVFYSPLAREIQKPTRAISHHIIYTPPHAIILYTSYLPCTKMYRTRSGIVSHIQLPVFNPMNCACAVAVAWIETARNELVCLATTVRELVLQAVFL